MYKKAFHFDEQTIFYFDDKDHKWVAQGGSLSWRTNNPGLLQVKQLKRATPISHCHRVAIFPDVKTGTEALVEWLLDSKWHEDYLKKIAEHLNLKDGEETYIHPEDNKLIIESNT